MSASFGNDLQFFDFGADSDLSAAADLGNVFFCFLPVQVVEFGCFITTNLVPGGTTVAVADLDITSASIGTTGSETTAPTRGSASVTLNTSSSNVTHQDGKVLNMQCDFTAEKGETITCQGLANVTSGAARFYMLYRVRGQSQKDAGVQREAEAAE